MITFKKLLPLYVVVCLGFLGYALTIALFIPMLMDKSYPLLPFSTLVSVRVSLSGFLLAMYPLGQFLGSPVIGNLSDRFGRKKVLSISLFLSVLGFIGIASSILFLKIFWLFVSSFLTGLCESNMAISQTVIADKIHDSTQKTRFIGYVYAACSMGYTIGPLLGGIGGSMLGYSAPFWITALGVLLVTIWVQISFTDDYVPKATTNMHIIQSITAMRSIFTSSNLRTIYLINFFIFFAVQGLYRVVPLYMVDKWHPSLHLYTLVIAYVSIICFLANLFVLNPISKCFSTKVLLWVLLFIGGFSIWCILLPSHFSWIWLTYGIAVIPTVMALPVCTTWLSGQAASVDQGQVLGNNQALLVLGEASSAAVGGLIAAIMVPLPIFVMGFILLVAGVVVMRY